MRSSRTKLKSLQKYPARLLKITPQVGKLRCELSYRRCETSVEDLLNMIRLTQMLIYLNIIRSQKLQIYIESDV